MMFNNARSRDFHYWQVIFIVTWCQIRSTFECAMFRHGYKSNDQFKIEEKPYLFDGFEVTF